MSWQSALIMSLFSTSCRRKQPSTHKQQSKDLSVSANVAYGQVKKMESSAPGTYEELDTLAGGGAPVYATADETTATPTEGQKTL